MDHKQPRTQSPQDKKDLSYRKESRINSGESRHGERKNRPRPRAQTHRAYRRHIRQVLSNSHQEIDSKAADAIMDDALNVRRPSFVIWPPTRLGNYVLDRLRYRAHETGRKFFRCTYHPEKHREAFARFLESVVTNGSGPNVELAKRFHRIINGTGKEAAFLRAFLQDAPEWEPKLTAWIEQVLGDHSDKLDRR